MKIALTGVLEDGTPRRPGAEVPADPRAALVVPKGADVELVISVVRPDGSPVQLVSGLDEVLFTVKRRPEESPKIARAAVLQGNLAAVTLVPSDTRRVDPGLYGWDAWLTQGGERSAIIPLSQFRLLDANAAVPFTVPPAPPPAKSSSLFEIPLTVGGYDGDPNDPGAPDALKQAAVGTWYLRETPTNTIFRKLTAAADSWEQTLPAAAAGGITGNVGAVDNAIIRADGITGSVIQGSLPSIDDAGNLFGPVSASIYTLSGLRLGLNASSSSTGIAVGTNASASGSSSVGIGNSASAGGNEATAIGKSASAIGAQSSAVGAFATSSTASFAGGHSALASGTRTVAVGFDSYAANTSSIGIGDSTQATGLRSIVIGGFAAAGVTESIVIGFSADATHAKAAVIGKNAQSTATNRCTIGTIGGADDLELQCGLGLGVFGATPPSSQPSKISDPAGQTTDLDVEARAAINAIIDVLEGAGLAASA